MARAPGRLDVMGGIADYSGSLVLQVRFLSWLVSLFSAFNAYYCHLVPSFPSNFIFLFSKIFLYLSQTILVAYLLTINLFP